jgi:hypothetical protein
VGLGVLAAPMCGAALPSLGADPFLIPWGEEPPIYALIPCPISGAFRFRFRRRFLTRKRGDSGPVVRAVGCSRRAVAGVRFFSRAAHGVEGRETLHP